MRDRLIELIQKEVPRPKADALAYHLLANGVVLLDFAVVTPENRPLITQIANMPLNDVCELIKAKQEGRIIVPPCKVGDTVYYLARSLHTHIEKVKSGKVVRIAITESGVDLFVDNYVAKLPYGKRVFLTKEEAEEKLKELKDNAT